MPENTERGGINMSRNLWYIVWLIVSFVGIIAVILGNYYHFITVLVGTLMMTICEADDDNQAKSE